MRIECSHLYPCSDSYQSSPLWKLRSTPSCPARSCWYRTARLQVRAPWPGEVYAAAPRGQAESCNGGQSAFRTCRAWRAGGKRIPGCWWLRWASKGDGGERGARAPGWLGGGGCVETRWNKGPPRRGGLCGRNPGRCWEMPRPTADTRCSRTREGSFSGS